MRLIETDIDSGKDGGNGTVMRKGRRAVFECVVRLPNPFEKELEYDGLSLQMEEGDGTTREDGCLYQTVIPENQRCGGPLSGSTLFYS